jgi:hypothetical protein
MKLIKKLLKMTYTREVLLLFIVSIAVFSIYQTSWLTVSKILLTALITGIFGSFAFNHLDDGRSHHNKRFHNFLLSLFFAIILFSICVLISFGIGYFMDEQPSYTNHYVYPPIQIVKDSNEVRVIGKTQIFRSVKITDYLSNDLKICKDERYSTGRIRLSDSLYICK